MNSQVDLLTPEDGELKIKCIKVKQPIGDFFIGVIAAKDLVDITVVDVRRMNKEERGFESYLGVQRPLSKKRAKELSSYVNTVDACFPSGVILSVDHKCAEYDEAVGVLTLRSYSGEEDLSDDKIPYSEIARVIDGQHRIAGLESFGGEDFEINVSIFVDIDQSTEAYIFSTVNLAQTKVTKSLVYDLYDLARKNSPQKLCHNIAVTLNRLEESPLHRRIKRLGSASPHNLPGAITQAAFVHSLIRYVSEKPQIDRDLYMRGKKPQRASPKEADKLVFRNFLIDERDFDLTDIIWNYFDAVRERWSGAWSSQDRGVMLSKTNGFMGLMRYLRDCYLELGADDKVYEKNQFLQILSSIDLSNDDFNTDNFKPGTSGESKLYRCLKAGRMVD